MRHRRLRRVAIPNSQALSLLGRDLREAHLQEAIKCMHHSKRTMLTTDDVDSALNLRNVELIYGFASGDPLRFRRTAGHKDLFYIDDKDLDFKDVFNYLDHSQLHKRMASFSMENFVGNGSLKELLPKLIEEGWDDVPMFKIMNSQDMDGVNMTQQQKANFLKFSPKFDDSLEIRSNLHDHALMQYEDKLEASGKCLPELLGLSTGDLSTQFGIKRGHITRFTDRTIACAAAPLPPSYALPSRRRTTTLPTSNSIYKNAEHSRSLLSLLFILMFVVGLVKYCERVCVLYLSTDNNFRDSIQDITTNESKIMKECKLRELEGYHVTAHQVLEVDQSIPNTENKLLTAYGFLDMVKRLFADLILGIRDEHTSRSIFDKILADKAFKIIEIELGIIYDLWFTKAKVIYSYLGISLRIVGIIITFLVLMMVSLSESKLVTEKFHQHHHHRHSNINFTITLILLS
ncbi:unnamed protein product [Camellia sinensis]